MNTLDSISKLIKETREQLAVLKSTNYITAGRDNYTIVQDIKNKIEGIKLIADLLAKQTPFNEASTELGTTATFVYNGYMVKHYIDDMKIRLSILKLEKRLKGLRDYRKYFEYFEDYRYDTRKYRHLLAQVFGRDKEIKSKFLN